MDVAKYIGLFLFKNQFCYIHGLGNLELKKRAASFSGNELQGSSYEVMLTPTGSIDDNLANFIATNEQISISKASNALREFSTQARADLQAGKEVIIPALGKFVEDRGKISFITDPTLQYTPPGIPAIKVAKRAEDTYIPSADAPPTRPQYKEEEEEAEQSGISWVKIGMFAGAVIVLALIVYFGMRFMNSSSNSDAEFLPSDSSTVSTVQNPGAMPSSADSGMAVNTGNELIDFDAILNTYQSANDADKRMQKLKSYGHNVAIVEDSPNYYVVLPFEKVSAADTTRLLDSLSRIFNPMGVHSLK
jgi:nucleoid DNA-binding protein